MTLKSELSALLGFPSKTTAEKTAKEVYEPPQTYQYIAKTTQIICLTCNSKTSLFDGYFTIREQYTKENGKQKIHQKVAKRIGTPINAILESKITCDECAHCFCLQKDELIRTNPNSTEISIQAKLDGCPK